MDQSRSWMKQGNCHNMPELTYLFFSSKPKDAEKARELCRTCPVRKPCLEYGLQVTKELNVGAPRSGGKRRILYGVWGGKGEFGIKKERRLSRREASPPVGPEPGEEASQAS